MEVLTTNIDMIKQLQSEVCSLQRAKKISCDQLPDIGLSSLEKAFSDHQFPTGTVHEFLSNAAEDATATSGFIAALAGGLMQSGKTSLWVSTKRTVFPAGLKTFGLEPDRVIFIDVSRSKDALWIIEEGLKCNALAAVIGEVGELSFTQSRRLQLAVEQSHVTGFVHCQDVKGVNATACVTRWKVRPIASHLEEGMPGVGYARWDVQLLKVRNGKPGWWQFEWSGNSFHPIPQKSIAIPNIKTRIAG